MDDTGENTGKRYRIRSGTVCEVMSPNARKWRKHVTQKETTFGEPEGGDKTFLIFNRNGWRMRVPKCAAIRLDIPFWGETKAGLPPLGGGIVSPSEAEDVLSKLEAGWR